MVFSSSGLAAPAHRPRQFPFSGGSTAIFALLVLFSMNLLNYVDRFSFFAVGTHVQNDLHLSNSRLGILNAAFIIVYTVASPLFGWLGDRLNRSVMLTFGVGLWSLATIATAFAQDFNQMFFWRALLGVGEATYGVIAPALLADLFSVKHRGRVMGLYYLALPLGGALGYGIGGSVAQEWHWRATFWVVGLPGLLVAALGLAIRDPGRGASDGHEPSARRARPRLNDYLTLFRTPTFVYNTLGMAAVTFATGGHAAWGSTFYQTVRGMTAKDAGVWIGALTAVAGLVGIGLGTWLADALLSVTRRAYLLIAAVAVLVAVPFGALAIIDPHRISSLGLLFGAMMLLSMVLGPCNAVTANVVPANQRAAGYALSIFVMHLLGDIPSPILIGAVADWFGQPRLANSIVGRAVAAIGATPVGQSNLTLGMLLVAPVLLTGSILFVFGSRHLAEDQQRSRPPNPDAAS